jgi:hypothetical protein
MSNGAGKDYGGALLKSARQMTGQVAMLEAKLLVARSGLREIALHSDAHLNVIMIAYDALEASK